jgi:hypothetical protein
MKESAELLIPSQRREIDIGWKAKRLLQYV